METKHTPGPWKFLPAFGRVEVEKFIVAYLSLSVEGRENPIYLSTGEAEANGRLIAATPDLLEACEFVEEFLARLERNVDEDDPLHRLREKYHAPIHDKLRPAIKKAKGEP